MALAATALAGGGAVAVDGSWVEVADGIAMRDYARYNVGPASARQLLDGGWNLSNGVRVHCTGTKGPMVTLRSCTKSTGCEEIELRSQCYVCRGSSRRGSSRPYLISEECHETRPLCPVSVPIAAITHWKAGGSSVADWVHAMDKDAPAAAASWLRLMEVEEDHRAALAAAALRPLQREGDLQRTELRRAAVAKLRSGYGGCYRDWGDEALGRWVEQALAQEQSHKAHAEDHCVGLLAQACTPCCVNPGRRQILVFLRNPFRRLESIFKQLRDFFAGDRDAAVDPKACSQTPFDAWVKAITKVPAAFLQAIKTGYTLINGPGRFESAFHLIDMALMQHGLSDERLYELAGADARCVPSSFVTKPAYQLAMTYAERATFMGVGLTLQDALLVRLEHMEEDLARVRQVLCRQRGYCGPLPPFPWRHQRRKALEANWTPELVSRVNERYRDDFLLGRYDFEPFMRSKECAGVSPYAHCIVTGKRGPLHKADNTTTKGSYLSFI